MPDILPMVFVFLSVGAVSLFSFIAVASWADARRREREAYYRSETLKKIAETQGGQAVVDLIRDERRDELVKHREGLKLGGLITSAVGIGFMIFMSQMERKQPAYLVGLIPLLIGVVLLVHAFFIAQRE
jgi:hypothetical protein